MEKVKTLSQREKVAQLTINNQRKKQIVRLINPRDEVVNFQFDSIPGISINPRVGSIKSRDFILVEVVQDFGPLQTNIINLTYWHDVKDKSSKATREIQWRDRIAIYMMPENPFNWANNTKFSYWRIIRSILLIYLIVHNLFLIYSVNIVWKYN